MFDKALYNILVVSFAFFFNLTAFSTLANAQAYIMKAIKNDTPGYNADGYIGLCIAFAVLALGNWFTPTVIVLIGPRSTLCIGSLLHFFFVIQFMSCVDWLYYVTCVLVGIGGALVWTAQGYYMTFNSTKETINRNSGLFWAIIQCSAIAGNLFILIYIREDSINKDQRNALFIVMSVMSGLGTVTMFLLCKKVYEGQKYKALKIFIQAMKLFIKRDMILLSITFCYSGIVLSFYSGVYSNLLGFTKRLKEKGATMVATSGMLIGAGEVAGGALFGILGHKTVRWGHYPVVIMGCIIHCVCFILIFINIPNSAVYGPTEDSGFIESNKILALICSFLLGFGDACFITQIYGTLGSVFVKESASAFAIFKFIQSSTSAIAFFYSSIGLFGILGILTILCIIGTLSFCLVELKPTYVEPDDDNKIVSETNKGEKQ